MKAGEIRQLSDDELGMKLRNAEEDLFKLRFQKHTGQLSNTAQLRLTKKDIARLRTEVQARELTAKAEKESSDE
jgi:large subunit ribosomal protein L29